jgi:hypothetical protein
MKICSLCIQDFVTLCFFFSINVLPQRSSIRDTNFLIIHQFVLDPAFPTHPLPPKSFLYKLTVPFQSVLNL